MLRQRPAGDKSWPIACSHATLGDASKELDLTGAHLSYGDFNGATFEGRWAIKLNGAGLTRANLSGSEIKLIGPNITLEGGTGTIDFTKANLTNGRRPEWLEDLRPCLLLRRGRHQLH